LNHRIHELVLQVPQSALIAVLLCVVLPAGADPLSPRATETPASPASEPAVTVARPAPRTARPSWVGLTFDLGMPDIIGVGLVVRPLWWLRVQAGGNTDLFSGGLGGGVVFTALRHRFSPAFSLDGGHVFAANTHGVPKAFGLNVDGQIVGYDYASAHAGLEIAINRRVSLSARGGVSFIDLTAVPDGSKPSPIKSADLHIWTPSGKLAVTVYL
jgi:hypothetical protein